MAQVPILHLSPPTMEGRPYTAVVLMQECIISRTHKIFVGCFDRTYLLIGHDPNTKYSFAAHLHKLTELEGISRIFLKLKELGVNLADLKMDMMGGHRKGDPFMQYGEKIAMQLEKEGVLSQVSMRWRRKTVPNPESADYYIPIGKKYMYYGGHLNPATGKFKFLKGYKKIIEICQQQRTESLKDTLNLFKAAAHLSTECAFIPLKTPLCLLSVFVV